LFALPALLPAQSYTASIRGVVTVASQGALPPAKITVIDVDRNTQRATVTDAAGRYVVTALPPGNYTLTAEASGFNKYSRGPFELLDYRSLNIDIFGVLMGQPHGVRGLGFEPEVAGSIWELSQRCPLAA